MRLTSTSFLSLLAVAATPAFATNFAVEVGANNNFVFSPDSISGAVAGDTITFSFTSRNHSATTTTFTSPCPPPPGGVGPNGFDTGFHVSPESAVVTLQDSGIHFVSCMQAAGAHCRAGMVFVVNPTEEQSVAAFATNARNS
ncbi:hypothetical protein V5O48_010983 [Marasmius crinis-equi]|uniref:Cupredoxin n=1 Tax=Marasmius crinis-equi TaxID=585013 RepID=A0ABR3F6W0_9AGAR